MTPIPTPKIRNIAAAPKAIDNVKGSAVLMMSQTGRLFWNDVPKQGQLHQYLPLGGPISRPATSPFMYSRYWTTRGLSRPRETRACAMRSGVQPLPQELAATSDGPAKNSRKVTMLVAMSSAIRARKRRIRNLSIVARVGWPPPVAEASPTRPPTP